MYYHEKLETLAFQWKNNRIIKKKNENTISNEIVNFFCVFYMLLLFIKFHTTFTFSYK